MAVTMYFINIGAFVGINCSIIQKCTVNATYNFQWLTIALGPKWVDASPPFYRACLENTVFNFCILRCWKNDKPQKTRLRSWVPRIICSYILRSFVNFCCGRTPYSSDLTPYHQTVTCLVLWKYAYEVTIMPVMRHCKTLVQMTTEVGTNMCSCSKVNECFWQRWRLHWKERYL
jgi:hypothetical protein